MNQGCAISSHQKRDDHDAMIMFGKDGIALYSKNIDNTNGNTVYNVNRLCEYGNSRDIGHRVAFQLVANNNHYILIDIEHEKVFLFDSQSNSLSNVRLVIANGNKFDFIASYFVIDETS